MKFYLISDNLDTLMGMRLSGIDGVVIHTEEEVKKTLNQVMQRADIAIVLITSRLMSLCPDLILDLKLNKKQPLIVEIPDRHGNGNIGESIAKYVHDAIGLKMD